MKGRGRLGSWLSVLVIDATGNHFFLDAAAGTRVVGIATARAALLTRRPATARQLGDGLGGHKGCLVLERG